MYIYILPRRNVYIFFHLLKGSSFLWVLTKVPELFINSRVIHGAMHNHQSGLGIFFETLPDLGGGWIEPISTKYAQVKLDSMFPKHRGEKLKQTFEVSPPPRCPVTALGEWNPIISSTKFQGLEIQQFFFRWPPVTRVTSPEVWHRSQEFFRRTFQAHQKNRPRLLCTQPFFEFVSFRHADVSIFQVLDIFQREESCPLIWKHQTLLMTPRKEPQNRWQLDTPTNMPKDS